MIILRKFSSTSKWLSLLLIAVALAGGTACGLNSQTTAEAPTVSPFPLATPTAQSPFSKEIDSLVPLGKCVFDQMAGALQRPRSELYTNVPYILDLTDRTMDQKARREKAVKYIDDYLTPIMDEIIESRCAHHLLLFPHNHSNETEAFMTEISRTSIFLSRIGLLSEDMRRNCFEWHETKANRFVSARKEAVEEGGEISGRFFDWHYAEASKRINAVCAEYLNP